MNRLQLKLFLILSTLVVGVIGLAAWLAPRGSFAAGSIALIGIPGLAGAALASSLIARIVQEPLEAIRQFAQDRAAGDFRRRLRWDIHDERSTVATSLNRMADRVTSEIDAARVEAQQLETVLSAMVEGVLVLDGRGRILLVNPSFRELFGVWGDVRDRFLVEILRHPEIQALVARAEDRNEATVRDIAVRDGSDRILLAHAVRFPNSGEPAGTLVVFQDVSEIRRLDRVRRDFIANASHELRTPLTSIQGFAETLSSSADLDPAEIQTCLGAILRNVNRMTNLINDLMDLSRIESTTTAADRARVDVTRIAEILIADMQQRLARAGITAKIRAAPGCGAAWGDRRALEHVLENLLTNAIRYSDEGGEILVEIKRKADRLEISVSDTGIGIPEESRERIFERFYRVDIARSRAVGSTGLGLSIVRHLVQALGGTIRVESEVGVGSRFTFSVPRAPDEPPSPPHR